jgi:hypothetical protein
MANENARRLVRLLRRFAVFVDEVLGLRVSVAPPLQLGDPGKGASTVWKSGPTSRRRAPRDIGASLHAWRTLHEPVWPPPE